MSDTVLPAAMGELSSPPPFGRTGEKVPAGKKSAFASTVRNYDACV